MSTDTRQDDGLSDPPRGAYRVLATLPDPDLRCMMDGAFATIEEARTHAGIATTQFDVVATEVIFDAYATPDEEF